MNLGPKRSGKRVHGLEGRIRVTLLDAADLALLHAGLLREGSLAESHRLASRNELAGQPEVRPECLSLGDRFGALAAGL